MKKSFMKMCALILLFSILFFTFNFSAYGQEFTSLSTTTAAFVRLSEVTNTPEPTVVNMPSPSSTPITINIGDYVQMGRYYDEPILWRCVDIDENGALMLADRIITIKPFDAAGIHTYADGTAQADNNNYRSDYGSNLWETSNMRCWLNSTATVGNITWLDGCPPTADKLWNGYNAYANEKGFLAEGNFTANEQNFIKSVTQKSLLNGIDVPKLSIGGTATHIWDYNISTVVQNYDTAYYHNVTDKMFLLDVKQLNKVYLNSATLGTNYYIGKPTQKSIDNSDYKDMSAISNWNNWIRSPITDSSDPLLVRCVHTLGDVDHGSAYFSRHGGVGVRPAFYINLLSVIFTSGNGFEGTPYVVAGGVTPTPSILYGDVNNDTVVDNKDLVLFKRFFAGLITSFTNSASADVNNDSVIDNKDLVLVKRYFAGVITKFPAKP